MTDTLSNPNETWRNFQKTTAIDACKLRHEDLKRLYRIFNEKQAEHGDRVIQQKLSLVKKETQQQFEERKNHTKNAFITTVFITGVNGDVVTGHGETIFDSAELPEKIVSIFYDTSFSPRAQLQYNPTDRGSLLLDFSHPPLLDLSDPPASPTPNNSNYMISAETDSWSRSLSSKLDEFFKERATSRNWLHKAATYDWLLLLLGMPLTLWGTFRLGNTVFKDATSIPNGLLTAFYIYIFFLLLSIFRGLFSYSRWMFPKVELQSTNSSAQRQRGWWYVIVIGLFIAALWDAIKWIGS